MMGNSTRHRQGGLRVVEVVAGDWSSGPLLVASTRRHRRLGLRPTPGPFGMMFRTRSLIGWGMHEPLQWFGMSATGVIVSSGQLSPCRLVVRAVEWMVELPVWAGLPPIGEAAFVIPILTAWPDD